MIAAWIAQAVMAGQSHLTLNKEQLAQWQVSGCRFNNGSPYGSLGMYHMMYLGQIAANLKGTLMALPLYEWPVGVYRDWDPTNKRPGVIPRLEATPVGDGLWAVPLVPEDPGHALNGLSFQLNLSAQEMAAIGPLAADLVGHCLLTSYCKTGETYQTQPIHWDDSRLQLAQLAGLGLESLNDLHGKGPAMARMVKTVAPLTLAMVQTGSNAQGDDL